LVNQKKRLSPKSAGQGWHTGMKTKAMTQGLRSLTSASLSGDVVPETMGGGYNA
jgi:hypothetical protein